MFAQKLTNGELRVGTGEYRLDLFPEWTVYKASKTGFSIIMFSFA